MVDWGYYDAERFKVINGMFLPDRGEGENMATQIVTAVNKLVYKWYNDGDVYDNRYALNGWVNDLSAYANWLAENVPGAKKILDGITECRNGGEYEDLLKELSDTLLDMEDLEAWAKKEKTGSIYDCSGEYVYEEYEEEEDEDLWEEEDYEAG